MTFYIKTTMTLNPDKISERASRRLRLIKPLMALVAMFASLAAHAAVERTTFTYSESPLLRLTRYTSSLTKARSSLSPCIIFAFGGGFTHGERDDARYLPFFEFMAERGYVVCTIDYRTTLPEFKSTGDDDDDDEQLASFGYALAGAIRTATTDFLTATGYVLANASKWGVDPTKIIASGSSVGAITALQAEYTVVTRRPPLIPATFNYAAAVTFAGAIFVQGTPTGLDRFCPAMLFHGDADTQVPYDALVLGSVGLYGSKYLATRFKEAGRPGAFWTELGAGHEMALTPMTDNLYDIAGFLDRSLTRPGNAYDWTTVTVPGRTGYKTDFTLMDYIKGNM